MQAVNCPTCNKEIKWSTANKSRPFCSERCKLIDLGNWADGTYAIPSSDKSSTDMADITEVA